MARKNKTIRKLTPLARKQAHIVNDLTGYVRRLDNIVDYIARIEFELAAANKALEYFQNKSKRERKKIDAEINFKEPKQ